MNFFHAGSRRATARPYDAATRLLLIRHADTDAAGARLAGRQPGVTLNHRGLAQLDALAASAARHHVAAVYSSPLERAMATAAAIASACRVSGVAIDDDLGEVDFGEWTGLSFAALDGRDDWRRYNAARGSATIPGGETPRQVQARMLAALRRIARHHSGVVAVVSHAEPIRYALLHAAGRTLDEWQDVAVEPASVHEFVELTG